jgi:dipeptide/tripeptide permease
LHLPPALVTCYTNRECQWIAIPYAIGGISELFINVPAYGIAYSRAPKNMRGLVSAINLLNTAVAYAIGLACSAVIKDPYLTWDFGGPSIVGFVLTVIFYFMFRHIDKEEYFLTEMAENENNDTTGHPKESGSAENWDKTSSHVGKVADNEPEEIGVSLKQ